MDSDSGMSMSMPMSFEWTLSTVLWFKQWTVHSVPGYVACLVGIAILALAHEFLADKRSRMLRVHLATVKAPNAAGPSHEEPLLASASPAR